jgi:hypothetical protein
LSVDPPPSLPLASKEIEADHANSDTSVLAAGQPQRNSHSHSRPVVVGLFGSYGPTSRFLEPLAEVNDNDSVSPNTDPEDDICQDTIPENSSDELELDGSHPQAMDTDDDLLDPLEQTDGLGNLSMYEDDTDEVVQHALALAKVDEFENAPRFADLYYASVQEDLHQLTHGISAGENTDEYAYKCEGSRSHASPSQRQSPSLRTKIPEAYPDLRPNARRPVGLSRPNRPRGPSSFSQRVQEKREAHGITKSASMDNTSSDEADEGPQDGCIKASIEGNYIHDSSDSQNLSSHGSPDGEELQRNSKYRYKASPEGSKQAGTVSSIGYRFTQHHEHPILDSTACSELGSNRSGSRLLPKPPLMAPENCLPLAPELVPTAPTAPATAPAHKYAAHEPEPVQRLEPSCSGSLERAASSATARPKLRAQPGSGESASSVKDKIRQLEERLKAAEQL